MPSRCSSDVSEPAGLSERLLMLSEDPNYTLTQVNGQRVYRKSTHAWSGPEPSRICEVFVGRIPHDCFEDTLVPLFQLAGELFEFRLMINFSGFNRGYGFAMYANPVGAQRAIVMFNNYHIRPSWQLGVCQSVNNCRLYIARIPAHIPSEDIVRLFYELTDEVVEVCIRRAKTGNSALVEYRSHRGAAMARKALVAAGHAWGGAAGSRPSVDWSQPHTLQLASRYREIGRWTPETGVQIVKVEQAHAGGAGGGVAVGPGGWSHAALPPPPSYSLEPWVRARRLREIETAERAGRGARLASYPPSSHSSHSSHSPHSSQSSQSSPLTSEDDREPKPEPATQWETLPPPPRARAPSPPRPATGHWVPEPPAPAAAPPPRAPGDYDPWSFQIRLYNRE